MAQWRNYGRRCSDDYVQIALNKGGQDDFF